jgi:PTH1 family peptidyl-tRNA hydrolase
MKLIVGLGNPGAKYQNTRHNFGFLAVDLLAKKLGLTWRDSTKLKAEVAKNTGYVLAKPMTFMNQSGFAVSALLKFYKLSPADLIVIHDELDIDFGRWKLSVDSRAAGHNGVQSIIDQLGSKKFARYRLGIRSDLYRGADADLPADEAGKFVLEKFNTEETKKLADILEKLTIELLK